VSHRLVHWQERCLTGTPLRNLILPRKTKVRLHRIKMHLHQTAKCELRSPTAVSRILPLSVQNNPDLSLGPARLALLPNQPDPLQLLAVSKPKSIGSRRNGMKTTRLLSIHSLRLSRKDRVLLTHFLNWEYRKSSVKTLFGSIESTRLWRLLAGGLRP
jgi:hypothetical protein